MTPQKHEGKSAITSGGRRPRTGGRSARVVRDVLARALEVFAERGYAGFSVEEAARRAGVNKTTVYRRWPTKADLLAAAIFKLRDESAEPPDTGSLRKDLVTLLVHRAHQMALPRSRAVMHAFLLGNADPELQAIVQRLRRERPAIPPVVFERAVARGELPKGTDARLLTEALLGPLHSRVHWKREPVTKAYVAALVDLVVSGAEAGGAQRSS